MASGGRFRKTLASPSVGDAVIAFPPVAVSRLASAGGARFVASALVRPKPFVLLQLDVGGLDQIGIALRVEVEISAHLFGRLNGDL